MHVRYKSLYISLPSSAKRQLETTKLCVVYGTWTTTANISFFHLEMNAVVCIFSLIKHVFRGIGKPNRCRQSRISLVKYRFFFFLLGVILGGVVLLIKLPISCQLVDMNFIFSCSTRHLTSERSERVRYRVEHSKLKFKSTRDHVISSISFSL